VRQNASEPLGVGISADDEFLLQVELDFDPYSGAFSGFITSLTWSSRTGSGSSNYRVPSPKEIWPTRPGHRRRRPAGEERQRL
jgi:hypothetical protein